MTLPTIPASWFLRLDGIDHSGGIHGRGHALRVWVHATELADEFALPHQLDLDDFGNVFRILKDADALDRLGDLDANYLRFPQSRAHIERAWVLLD